MTGLAGPCRSQGLKAGPGAGIVPLSGKPGKELRSDAFDVAGGMSDCTGLQDCGGRLAERAGVNLLRDAEQTPITVKLNLGPDRAAASRRPFIGGAVHPVQADRFRQ